MTSYNGTAFPGKTPTDLIHLLKPAFGSGQPELPFMAWGGYSIAYYCQSGDVLCSDCATVGLLNLLADTEYGAWAYDPPVICETADGWDGDYDLTCDNCYRLLAEGYYGDDA